MGGLRLNRALPVEPQAAVAASRKSELVRLIQLSFSPTNAERSRKDAQKLAPTVKAGPLPGCALPITLRR